jgi:hypothetical protein
MRADKSVVASTWPSIIVILSSHPTSFHINPNPYTEYTTSQPIRI